MPVHPAGRFWLCTVPRPLGARLTQTGAMVAVGVEEGVCVTAGLVVAVGVTVAVRVGERVGVEIGTNVAVSVGVALAVLVGGRTLGARV